MIIEKKKENKALTRGSIESSSARGAYIRRREGVGLGYNSGNYVRTLSTIEVGKVVSGSIYRFPTDIEER